MHSARAQIFASNTGSRKRAVLIVLADEWPLIKGENVTMGSKDLRVYSAAGGANTGRRTSTSVLIVEERECVYIDERKDDV